MRGRKKRFGFTVLELFVVIAIILILAGILVPVLAAGRTKALEAKCAVNMHGWGLRFYQYATENGGALPTLANPGDPLYACGEPLQSFFAKYHLSPKLAYSPSNSALYGTVTDATWANLSYPQETIDFDDPHVLVNNTDNETPAGAPTPVNTIVDDLDTAVGDNYFEVVGPSTFGRNNAGAGSYFDNYYTWVKCTAAGGITTFIVDNSTTSGADPDNYFEVVGTADSGTNTLVAPWPRGGAGATYSWIKCYDGNTTPGTGKWHFKVIAPAGMAGQPVTLKIEGYWPIVPDYGIPDAKFTVNHDGGGTQFTVNELTVGATAATEYWHEFGTFTFTYGQSYTVEISNSIAVYAPSNIYTIADAIRVSSVDTPTAATWHFKVEIPPGTSAGDSVDMEVQLNWAKQPSFGVEDIQATVFYEGGNSTATIDQRQTGATAVGVYNWQSLGTFSFNRGQSYRVELSNTTSYYEDPDPSNKYVIADAIKVIDPAGGVSGGALPSSGFAVLDAGWTYAQLNPTAFPVSSPDYLWANRTTTDHLEAVWVFTAPDGEHTVYGWWPGETSWDQASGVPFSIHEYDGTQIASATLSQDTGETWTPIATCTFVGGEKYYVKISSGAAAGDYVIADAIAIPKYELAEASIDAMGYLYLGYRANMPLNPDAGPIPTNPVKLVDSVQGTESPNTTAILVDWLSDNSTLTSHKDFAHILFLGGGVDKVWREDAEHRWTSPDGASFYW